MDHQTPRPARWNGKTNGYAIASLTLSLFGCVGLLSVVFGIIGLRQSTRNGDKRGRRYAIAGLSICGLWVLGIAALSVVNAVRGPDRAENGEVHGRRSIAVTELRAGDCLAGVNTAIGRYVDVVPCGEPHDAEVVDRYLLPDGEWPGLSGVADTAQQGCDQKFQAYTGRELDDRSYTSGSVPPEFTDWPENRGGLCVAYHAGETRGSGRR